MMYNLKDTDYQLLFPENLKKYKNLKTLALQLESIFKNEIISQIPKLAIFENLELQSDEILSELAWQYAIDNWEETLSRDIKIKLIKNAYWAHSKKGTKKVVETNLSKLSYPVTLLEWFEYGGKPFTFKIVANHINTNPAWIDELSELIAKYKNCRSVLDTVSLDREREIGFLKFSKFRTIEFEKEFTGVHEDIEKKSKIIFNKFRTMEVMKNV